VSLLPKLLRCLCWLALGIYFAAGFSYLGLRYWVIPNIDTWRPAITRQIAARLDVQLTMGRITLDWQRPDPVFVLQAVALHDDNGQRVLHLPRVAGRLAWRGLWRGKLWFQELELNGLELALHRDAQQRIRVLTQTFDVSQALDAEGAEPAATTRPPAIGLGHPFMRWLSQQKRVVLRDARLTWTDVSRMDKDGKALALDQVMMVWLHDADNPQRWQLGLQGQPDIAGGGPFQLTGEFHLNAPNAVQAAAENANHQDLEQDIENPANWDARLYVNVQDVVPDAWRQWLDLPAQLEAERLSLQWWLNIEQGKIAQIAVQSDLTRGRWTDTDTAGHMSVDVATAQMWVQGSWQAYQTLYRRLYRQESGDALAPQTTQAAAPAAPLNVSVNVQGATLHLPALFDQPLLLDDVRAHVGLGQDARQPPELTLEQVTLRNADMDLNFSGRWQPHARSQTGWLSVQGMFARADMAALASYFPRSVSKEARDWMRTGLTAGQIRQATFLLEGELDDFPFGKAPVSGQWRLDGRFENATIDYAPMHGQGWPKLEQMHGQLAMREADLRMTAQQARMRPAADHVIDLQDLQAHIPNLLESATLNVQGQSQAPAASYLALLHNSPLRTLLGGTFDETRARGNWRVPLNLTVPLLQSMETRVRGQVQFEPQGTTNSQVQLFDDMPMFEQVAGVLDFSEWAISTQNLSARFLDGNIVVSGGLGSNQNGLGISGHATVAALKQVFGAEHLTQLDGEFDYHVRVSRINDGAHRGRYRFSGQSNGVGISSTLPAPLTKAADVRWPVQFRWAPHDSSSRNARQTSMALHVQLAQDMSARLVRWNDATRPAPALGGFHQLAIGLGGKTPALPRAGLALYVKQKGVLDLSAWQTSLAALNPAVLPTPDEAVVLPAKPPPFLSVPAHIHLQADQLQVAGLVLDAAKINVDYEPAQRLQVVVDATQAAGTVAWQVEPHRVDAHFSRFALDMLQEDGGQATASDESGSNDLLPDELDLPGIALTIDDFSAAGLHLGSLSVQGSVAQRGRLWMLDSVTLTSPSAQLSGQGQWRLRPGQDGSTPRGLSLQAELASGNVGDYLREIGLGDLMQGGAGTVTAQLEWAHLPWHLRMEDLSGSIKLNLQKGRLISIRSSSAKLLELLSVQSLQRLFSVNLRLGDIFSGGFPFDRWAGTLYLGQGRVQTNDYRMRGAVGDILLAGDMAWHTGELNMQAMVVPRVDMSGASLAAGIVNPLVGVGALLAQWLLRNPLSKAMTLHYSVTGNWKDPKIEEVSANIADAPNSPERDNTLTGEH